MANEILGRDQSLYVKTGDVSTNLSDYVNLNPEKGYGFTTFDVATTKTTEEVPGGGFKRDEDTRHRSGTVSGSVNVTTGENGNSRVAIWNGKKCTILHRLKDSGPYDVYVLNLQVEASGAAQGLQSLSISGDISRAPTTQLI